ncbi:acyl carrier protein [Flavihumibacter profundi]|jgi:acyl carrier protein|uniref:acyl carrier protein n=1 Tax=Flavihumibacter profundi TaxID=2716883 RepID=UPI001CC4B9E8|nr:acyl carrier protein [Flavihumibacter profundi]MBZ5855589.1 acyl carrier protein [Flavihumibacter profundi]
MNEPELKQTILKMLKKVAPDSNPETLQPDDNIRQVLEMDSFDALQFIVALDEHLGIEIPEEDYGKIDTLNKLIAYLKQNMQKG